MQESLKIKGLVTIKKYRDGKPFSEIKKSNLVVDSGLQYFVDRILGTSAEVLETIGVGTGTTAAAAGDTGFETGTNASETQRSLLDQGNIILIEALFGDVYTGNDVNEICLFTDGGTLISRTVLDVADRFTKIDGEDVSVAWQLTFGDSV